MSTCVVLFSGGLDSYIAVRRAALQFKSVVALYIDINHPYARKERMALKRLEPTLPKNVEVRRIELGLLNEQWGNMPTPERQVIPGRNLIFATIAASFGDTVWLGALEDEMHEWMPPRMEDRMSSGQRDKCKTFFQKAGDVISYVFETIRENTKFATPFEHETKSDTVKWALSHGVSHEELLQTSTCYHPVEHACGECSTCFKRWVAMTNNGVTESHYSKKWWTSDAAEKAVSNYLKAVKDDDYSHYTRKRVEETAEALALVGDIRLYNALWL